LGLVARSEPIAGALSEDKSAVPGCDLSRTVDG